MMVSNWKVCDLQRKLQKLRFQVFERVQNNSMFALILFFQIIRGLNKKLQLLHKRRTLKKNVPLVVNTSRKENEKYKSKEDSVYCRRVLTLNKENEAKDRGGGES